MIVFGGVLGAGPNATTNENFNDVWRLNRNLSWTSMSPAGTPPAPRSGPSAVYDDRNNRMIVFGGGLGFASPCENDVWILTNANDKGGTPTWTQLSPSGSPPAPRARHTAVYDPHSNRMIVFGGNNCFSTNLADVWVLSNANGLGGTPTWTQLSPSGASPDPRSQLSAVYDHASNRMIIFGGESAAGYNNDVWVLSHANGIGGTPTWTQMSPSGTIPPGRTGHSAVYDATNNRMTIFGGGNATNLADAWVLSTANGIGGTPSWTQLGPFAIFPEGRVFHTAVYDPSTNDMTIFGGYTALGATNNVWVLHHANGL